MLRQERQDYDTHIASMGTWPHRPVVPFVPNPADKARIDAAEAKRERKAQKAAKDEIKRQMKRGLKPFTAA